MVGQCDSHKSYQAGKTHFYGRPPPEKESPPDRTHLEDDNRPPTEAGSLLIVTTRTKTTWQPVFATKTLSRDI